MAHLLLVKSTSLTRSTGHADSGGSPVPRSSGGWRPEPPSRRHPPGFIFCFVCPPVEVTKNELHTDSQLHHHLHSVSRTSAETGAGGAYHWATREQAIAELSTPTWGWEAGPGEQTCPTCCRVRECQNLGHDWQTWSSLAAVGRPDLLDRVCARCGADEIRETPTGGFSQEVEA